jgi:hypothetical protein
MELEWATIVMILITMCLGMLRSMELVDVARYGITYIGNYSNVIIFYIQIKGHYCPN